MNPRPPTAPTLAEEAQMHGYVTPTVTRLTIGRRYTVLGQRGLRYLGGTPHGLHVFRGERGTETHQDAHLAELMARGHVRPEGPEPDQAA